jgi:ribosome maturation factor RimP
VSLEHDIKAVVESQGLLLYDATVTSSPVNGEKIYELLLMRANKAPVSLDECAHISNLISPLLDVTPPVSGEYRLEVGTPGIERKLKNIEHFAHSINELVKVTLLDGTHYMGTLLHVEGKTITLKSENEGEVRFDFDEVTKARTYFEW